MDNEIFKKYADEMMRMKSKATPVPENAVTVNAVPIQNADGDLSIGSLLVNVTTLRELYPVPDASVKIFLNSGNEKKLIASGNTDNSGKTEKFMLSTPEKKLSESAGADERPYAVYDIEITADGYVGQLRKNVPVFPGVLSVQSVDLLMLSAANGNTGMQVTDENEQYDL